jgi:regulator of ribonuclease activity A
MRQPPPSIETSDLCDVYPDRVSVVAPGFGNFGGWKYFSGRIATVQCFEDNSMVRDSLSSEGQGRVLVIDAGGSTRCALVGDRMADLGMSNNWRGIVLNGCIRDAIRLADLPFGVKAIGCHPMASQKRGEGRTEVPVTFAGVRFVPGHYLYADADGIIVSEEELAQPPSP